MRNDLLISIVIVGHNVATYLSGCLESIYHQSYKNLEVIFVNNGSRDNTVDLLRAYPGVRVINNNENKGFCFANNQGIKVAKGDYILSLNSDIVLDKDFLVELKKVAEASDAGLFGPKILKRDGRTIDSTGLELSRFYRFFDRGMGEIDRGQYDAELHIFGPCGGASLYKREMLEDIRYNGEYFDEYFFFLGEDFDLAWRARNKGWRARFVPSAICYHTRNSSNFNDRFRQYLSFRNRFYLLIKNGRPGIRYLIVFLFYDIPRLIFMLFTNRYTARALYEIVMNTPGMLKKRIAWRRT